MLASIGIWIKSHLIVSILLGTGIISVVIATPFIISSMSNNAEENKQEIKKAENNNKEDITCEENFILNDEGICVENIKNDIENKETSSNNGTSSNSGNSSNNKSSNSDDSSNNGSTIPNGSGGNSNSNNTDDNKDKINLNDNVLFYEILPHSCSEVYIHIKNVCWNKTIGQLKSVYPDYDKILDENMVSWGTSDDTLFHSGYLDYFPDCSENISQALVSEIDSKLKGHQVGSYNGARLKFKQIVFKESKYNSFKSSISQSFLSNYKLSEYGGCGDAGGSVPIYLTLDEIICSKYNLSCGKW